MLILGGGTAGVGTAAQLRNAGVEDICIVEPSDTHYYQVGDGWDGSVACGGMSLHFEWAVS